LVFRLPTGPEHNLAEVRRGPLEEDDMRFMRDFGDVVYRGYKYFM
jgi:hypothetical protein